MKNGYGAHVYWVVAIFYLSNCQRWEYRRKVIYNQYKADIRNVIKQLCSYKGVEIIEGHLMLDHIHMLVSIPPKIR